MAMKRRSADARRVWVGVAMCVLGLAGLVSASLVLNSWIATPIFGSKTLMRAAALVTAAAWVLAGILFISSARAGCWVLIVLGLALSVVALVPGSMDLPWWYRVLLSLWGVLFGMISYHEMRRWLRC